MCGLGCFLNGIAELILKWEMLFNLGDLSYDVVNRKKLNCVEEGKLRED